MYKKQISDTEEVWPEWMSTNTSAKFLDMTPDTFRNLYRTKLMDLRAHLTR